jgi:hypothetical protein
MLISNYFEILVIFLYLSLISVIILVLYVILYFVETFDLFLNTFAISVYYFSQMKGISRCWVVVICTLSDVILLGGWASLLVRLVLVS